MLYQVIQILYWLVLSIWFGGVVFVVLAAPAVFRAVGQRELRLPDITAAALRGEHQTLVAGDVVAGLLQRLGQIQLLCLGAMLPLLLATTFFMTSSLQWLTLGEKALLYALSAGVVLYDRWKRFPITLRARQRYIEHADEPEVADLAKAEFEASHRASERAYHLIVFLLLLLVLVSANPEPRHSWTDQDRGQSPTPAASPAK